MSWVIDFISEVRSVRAEMNVPAGAKIACVIVGANGEIAPACRAMGTGDHAAGRLKSIDFEDKVPAASAQIVLGEAVSRCRSRASSISPPNGRGSARSSRRSRRTSPRSTARLGNPGFVAKAPEEVLEEARERKTALAAQRVKLEEAISRLK